MSTRDAISAMIEGDDTEIVRSEPSALEAITRSEVSVQLDAAHKYPRSVTKAIKDARVLVTASVEVAESCLYELPRDGKSIVGPSVRLAEILAVCWGNLHLGARVIDDGGDSSIAQAVAWDLEKNVRVTIEARRGLLNKYGKRYSDDMVRVTGMAAISVAYRNAVFRIVPRTYVNFLYEEAKAVAVGDAQTFGERKDRWLSTLGKMGITNERVFSRLGIAGSADMTADHLATLIGLGNAIKAGDTTLDEAFPSVTAAPSPVAAGTPEGKRVKLPTSKGKAPSVAGSPAPANDAPASDYGNVDLPTGDQ
jgi:hypothetical protein